MIEKRLKNAVNSRDEKKINNAFNEFYDHYFKLIYYIISQYIDNDYDVEDLTQDVFIKFFNNLLKINMDGNIKYYLTTMAKNMALNYLKSQNKKIIYKDNMILSIIDDNSYHNKLIYETIIDDLKEYLDDLEMQIVLLHVIEGAKFKDISHKMNKPTNTVITIYHRAIKKFKKRKGVNENDKKIYNVKN